MTHFPIFSNHWKFTKKDIINYLNEFPDHKVIMKNTFHDQSGAVQLSTFHKFNDGLNIRCFWEANDETNIYQTPFTKWETIYSLVKRKVLKCTSFNFASFSQEPNPPSLDVRTSFEKVIAKKNYSLSKKEYERLEHFSCEQLSTPDSFFADLTKHIQNVIDFEMFYEKKKNAKKQS